MEQQRATLARCIFVVMWCQNVYKPNILGHVLPIPWKYISECLLRYFFFLIPIFLMFAIEEAESKRRGIGRCFLILRFGSVTCKVVKEKNRSIYIYLKLCCFSCSVYILTICSMGSENSYNQLFLLLGIPVLALLSYLSPSC